MWRVNPGNFFGMHVSHSVQALACAFWAFSLLPSPVFCNSEHDPCSCKGGGFEIFKPFCDAAAAAAKEATKKMHQSNATNSSGNETVYDGIPENAYVEYSDCYSSALASFPLRLPQLTCLLFALPPPPSTHPPTNPLTPNSTLNYVKAKAKNEYVGIFQSLEGSRITIAFTVVVIFVIILIFTLARSLLFAAETQREKEEAERQKLELLEQNKRIQKELSLNALNEEQTEIVHAGAAALEAAVPSRFKISSSKIMFEVLLGSGSFGDCYKGYFHNVPVAVKQMRVVSFRSFVPSCTFHFDSGAPVSRSAPPLNISQGLINNDGFEAFSKEVLVLAEIQHENIVTFTGYSLEPTLLIVMEFVEGGTLRDYLEAQDPLDPPSPANISKILIGSAMAFAYLHAIEPLPILHRDIKSENILVTKDLEPRVADLGEARVMAENRTMTMGEFNVGKVR